MLTFSNPRLTAEFSDWPIGGKNRGQCKFAIEDVNGKYRVIKQTTNKAGAWCKPKKTTFGGKAVIVDGDDGRTYVLQGSRMWQHIVIWRSDFMQEASVHESSDPTQYEHLMVLIDSCYS